MKPSTAMRCRFKPTICTAMELNL